MFSEQKISYQIENSQDYALLALELKNNQSILADSSLIFAREKGIIIKSNIEKIFINNLSQKYLTISEINCQAEKGKLYIAPPLPGEIQHYYFTENTALFVQYSAFLASDINIIIEPENQIKNFFSEASFGMLPFRGTGDFWFSAYGKIVPITVNSEYFVETGYLVAFEETLQYKLEFLEGLSYQRLKPGIFGGEGLVCRFKGEGKLWVQSRSLYPLVTFLNPFRKAKLK
jgi:uncharacterized protein (TIGR00266 family)